MEHPDIRRMNKYGSLKIEKEPEPVNTCDHCGKDHYEDDKVIEMKDDVYCNMECLMEKMDENPSHFNIETITLGT